MLGYFSLVGLLRVHSVLGDYATAIKVGRGSGRAGHAWLGRSTMLQFDVTMRILLDACGRAPNVCPAPVSTPCIHTLPHHTHPRPPPAHLPQSMAPLHPFLRKSLFTTKIPMACITMFYYTG